MGRIYGSSATRKREMDNDCGRGRRADDTGLHQYQLLFLQVLRGPGKFEKRALQGRTEIVRSADGRKQILRFAWPGLSNSSRRPVAIPVRRRNHKVSCTRTGIRNDSRPTGTAITEASGRERIGLRVLPRKRAVP